MNEIIESLNLLSFLRLDSLNGFKNQKHISPIVILYLVKPPISEKKFMLKNTLVCSMGKFHQLYNNNIFIGYIFEFPKYDIKIEENFIILKNLNIEFKGNPKLILVNKYLCIREIENKCLLINKYNNSYLDINKL